jgi:hypothetical protein
MHSMDEDQFAALRRWGEGLRADARHEVRAAGKAIVLLCDEVERLEIALLNERTLPRPADEHDRRDGEPEPATTLHRRLEQLRTNLLRR